jgi:hypothetical protein
MNARVGHKSGGENLTIATIIVPPDLCLYACYREYYPFNPVILIPSKK